MGWYVPEKVELIVPLFPVHELREELAPVPRHKLSGQLNHVCAIVFNIVDTYRQWCGSEIASDPYSKLFQIKYFLRIRIRGSIVINKGQLNRGSARIRTLPGHFCSHWKKSGTQLAWANKFFLLGWTNFVQKICRYCGTALGRYRYGTLVQKGSLNKKN